MGKVRNYALLWRLVLPDGSVSCFNTVISRHKAADPSVHVFFVSALCVCTLVCSLGLYAQGQLIRVDLLFSSPCCCRWVRDSEPQRGCFLMGPGDIRSLELYFKSVCLSWGPGRLFLGCYCPCSRALQKSSLGWPREKQRT